MEYAIGVLITRKNELAVWCAKAKNEYIREGNMPANVAKQYEATMANIAKLEEAIEALAKPSMTYAEALGVWQ